MLKIFQRISSTPLSQPLHSINRQFILKPFKRYPRKGNQPKQRVFPQIDQKDFITHSTSKQNILDHAFTDLKNDESRITGIEIYENENEHDKILNVTITDIGDYTFKVNTQFQKIYFTSPMSGVNEYYLDLEEDRWCSVKDDHNLDELLTRETLGKLKGYLKL